VRDAKASVDPSRAVNRPTSVCWHQCAVTCVHPHSDPAVAVLYHRQVLRAAERVAVKLFDSLGGHEEGEGPENREPKEDVNTSDVGHALFNSVAVACLGAFLFGYHRCDSPAFVPCVRHPVARAGMCQR
jgi:hypothetical protein